MKTPDQLAHAFCAMLRRWLTADQLATVNTRNATRAPGVCHSHDFCDANQAMAFAFGDELNLQDDQHLALINAAWDIARDRGFAA